MRPGVGYVARFSKRPSDPTRASLRARSSMSASQSDSKTRLTLHVNGEERTLPGPCSVAELLECLGLGGKRVAVARNRSVVVRSRYTETRVGEGDRIEILEAVGGG